MVKNFGGNKNIVIVGGGAGGVAAARLLSTKLDSRSHSITIISPRPHLVIWPATIRAAVADVDNLDERVFIPLDKIFANSSVTVVRGKVTSVNDSTGEGRDGSVVLENGDSIDYHVLILSPGSILSGPVAFPENEKEVKSFITKSRTSFEKAQNIVIAGGGAVGIELAGEIKDFWPGKRVTIVQGDAHLLNSAYPDKARKRIEARLRAHGTDIILDDFVDNLEIGPIGTSDGVRTRNGKLLQTDLVVSARGPRPNTEFIAASLGADTVTTRGLVKVLPTLQLPAHPNIFALGDIIDWNEQKQLAKAMNGHAPIVANNVQAYLSGQKLKPYKGSTEMLIVTVGKNGGVSFIGMFGGIIFGDWFSRMIKSRDVFVDFMHKNLGV